MRHGPEMPRSSVPPLLVCTRFGLGIRDPAWLDHRLSLISSITAPSLAAQEDQDFQWAVFADRGLAAGPREALEDVIAPFDGRAFVYSDGDYHPTSVSALARQRGVVGATGDILTARLDDDDAWNRQTVGAVRERVGSWLARRGNAAGLALTFESGLEWVMYDMVDVGVLQETGRSVTRTAAVRPYALPFHSMSVFVYSRLEEGTSALSAAHSRIADRLASRGFAIEISSTSSPMWLYCRHKQTMTGIQRMTSDAVDMTLLDLARIFGIDEDRTQRYLEDADNHGYGLVRGADVRRVRLARALLAVDRKLRDPATTQAQAAQLAKEKSRLNEGIAQLSENLVGGLDDGSAEPPLD